jgi:broad specificity phosphatase PhoE
VLTRHVYFITHPEVRVDPQTPVPDWSLSERGLARMRAGLLQPWIAQLTAVYASAERKAREAGAVITERLGSQLHIVHALGEIERSATGYLPHAEHEATADAMFAAPDSSARGWETARHAQKRIVAAVADVLAQEPAHATIAIVAHGAVGALLLCHLTGQAIARAHDQPGAGGGNYFAFRAPGDLMHGWQRFDL